MTDAAALTRQFVAGEVAPATFGHRAHMIVARELLLQHDFVTALQRFVHGARALAEAAGSPDAFNLTMTLAWLSMLAERMHTTPCDDIDALVQAHPELDDRRLLATHYSSERLGSALARQVFVLPDQHPAAPPAGHNGVSSKRQ